MKTGRACCTIKLPGLARRTIQGLRLAGARPANSANHGRSKQRRAADSQLSRPLVFQAKPPGQAESRPAGATGADR